VQLQRLTQTHLNSLQSAPGSATGKLSGIPDDFWYV
jgi:hypothetical protein